MYSPEGLLIDSVVEGLVESSAECTNELAALNRVVSVGVHLGLEVFRCADGKGWGARCCEPIWEGGIPDVFQRKLLEQLGCSCMSALSMMLGIRSIRSIVGHE